MEFTQLSPRGLAALKEAIHEICMVSLKASEREVAFGHPCDRLIARVLRIGVDAFTKELLLSAMDVVDSAREYRLNGAGLKLFVTVSSEGNITARVGGDQLKDYPKTAPLIGKILNRPGLQEEDLD